MLAGLSEVETFKTLPPVGPTELVEQFRTLGARHVKNWQEHPSSFMYVVLCRDVWASSAATLS
jgi:hypothetical protein